MSLYNMMFGENYLASVLLLALGTERAKVPRYRDCYIELDGDKKIIAIHTRTGGGNRDYYESEERCRENYPKEFVAPTIPPSGPWNDDLRKLPGFIRDADDPYDTTYATFQFEIPETYAPMILALHEMVGGTISEKPGERWQRVLEDLQNRKQTKETERALEIGKAIFAHIKQGEDQ